jgi:hypothetical protein
LVDANKILKIAEEVVGPWAHHGFHLLRENYLKPSSKGINAIIINFKAIGHMFSAISGSGLVLEHCGYT